MWKVQQTPNPSQNPVGTSAWSKETAVLTYPGANYKTVDKKNKTLQVTVPTAGKNVKVAKPTATYKTNKGPYAAAKCVADKKQAQKWLCTASSNYTIAATPWNLTVKITSGKLTRTVNYSNIK